VKRNAKVALESVCFSESDFRETIFMCLFTIRKVGKRKTLSGQQKILSSQRKILLGFQESGFFYFGRKTLSRSCEKFKNIILFTNYIKFGLQTFDCYIYIYCFEYLFFNFIIWNLIFILTLILIFILFFPYYFLIKMFYLSNLVLIFLIVTYFIWNNLWNVNYYYFNFLFNLYYFDYYLFYLR